MSTETFTSPEQVEKLEGPQVSSPYPQERKLSRALRIQKRLTQNKTKSGRSEDTIADELEKTNPIYLQKSKSNNILQKRIKEAERDLLEISISNNTKEVARREAEKRNSQKLIETLENDANRAQAKFDGIVQKWDDIQILKDPLATHRAIEGMKEQCDELIEQRNRTIATLKTEIERSEKAYNNYQRKNFDEVQHVFKKINNYIAAMRTMFSIQFSIVHATFNSATNNQIQNKYDTWNEQFYEMCDQVDKVCENRMGLIQRVDKVLDDTTKAFEENFRAKKAKLLRSVNISRQELENLKGAILLNSEKYEYNFQILERRCEESTILRAERKRKLTQLQDDIFNLKSTIHNFKTTTVNQIKKYEHDIKTSQKEIMDIENKAQRIATINDKLFKEIWDMSSKNCNKLWDKIMKIDKIIHEQLLGKEWSHLGNVSLDISTLPSFKTGQSVMAALSLKPLHAVASKLPILTGDFQITPSTTKVLQSNDVYRSLMKKILIVTSDKTGFLTEKRIKELLGTHSENDKNLVRLEHILNSMNLDKEEDLNLLLEYFLPYCYCLNCTTDDGGQEASLVLSTRYSFAPSTQEYDVPMEHIQLLEAMYHTTHSRQSIEEAVIEVVTSEVNLEECFEPSIESLDVAKTDMASLPQAKISKIKKNPLILLKEKLACQYSHSLVISGVFVVKALRDFIENYFSRFQTVPTTGERLRRRRFTISRLLNDDEIRDCWKNWLNNYGENSDYYFVWKGLVFGLQYYLDVLQKRKILSEEVLSLRKQNQRLKNSLESYRSNHRFLPPICATVKQPLFIYQRRIR